MSRKIYSALRNFIFSPLAARLAGEPFFFLMGMRKGKKPELGSIKSVLVVKLDELGDSVMLTPFVRELRAGLPQAWITLVVKTQLKQLWDTCPYVNEVIAFDRQTGLPNLRSHLSALSLAKNRLWKKRFDLAIVPRWDADYYCASYVAYLSGAPARLGYRSDTPENVFNYDRLYTDLLDNNGASRHEIEKNIEIIRSLRLGVNKKDPELWLDDGDAAFADAAVSTGNRLVIAYGIGANSNKRIWPVSNFLELTRRLQKELEVSIVVLGGQKEHAPGDALVEEFGGAVINLAGKTSLRQAAAVLKKCRIYVGNDSGLMHMAAAVGIPVVEISCHPAHGSTGHYNAPSRFGPWGVQRKILQPSLAIAPCLDACVAEEAHCIEKVSVDAVQKALKDLLR